MTSTLCPPRLNFNKFNLSVRELKNDGLWLKCWRSRRLSRWRICVRVSAMRVAEEELGEGTSEVSVDRGYLVSERMEARALVSHFQDSAQPPRLEREEVGRFDTLRYLILRVYTRSMGEEQRIAWLVIQKFGTFQPNPMRYALEVLFFEGQDWEIGSTLQACPALLEWSMKGKLPSAVSYCLSIGMTPEEVNEVLERFPAFAHYSVERKIMRVTDFVLSLGCSPDIIQKIIKKDPSFLVAAWRRTCNQQQGFWKVLG